MIQSLFSFVALFALATPALADEPPQCVTPCPAGPVVTSGANSAEAVQADVQSLRSEIRRLKARVRTLEGAGTPDLSEIERRLSYLEVALAGLDLESVRAELAEHDARLDSLETRVTALEGAVGGIADRVRDLEQSLLAPPARVVVATASVGASGWAANGHDIVKDDMVFHSSPPVGGAFDLSVGVLVRPKEVPLYFGAAVAPRISFDEGYGGSLVGKFGGTLLPAKGLELGLVGGVDYFVDPNLQAPNWVPEPKRDFWRGLVGAEANLILWRSKTGQEFGVGAEASVLPGRYIEGRFGGGLEFRF